MVLDAARAEDPRHRGETTAIAATKDAVHFVTAWKASHSEPRGAFASAAEADAFPDAARETR